MTIWRKGMLGVCVDDTPGRITGRRLQKGRVYRVIAVWERGQIVGVLDSDLPVGAPAWHHSRFRPAVLGDTRAGRELIALLDSPAPVTAYNHVHFEVPETAGSISASGLSGRPSHDGRNDGCANPTHMARAPVTLTAGSQRGEDRPQKLSDLFSHSRKDY